MFQTAFQSYRYALRFWRPLLISHLFVRLIVAASIVPVIGVLLSMTLAFSDQSALTDQDIARFLLSPAGAIGGVVVGAFIILAAVLDVAFMTAVLRIEEWSARRSLRVATGVLFSALPRILIFSALLLLRVLILALPFVALSAGTAAVLLTEFDINYYLANHPPEFIVTLAVAGVSLVVLVVLLTMRLLAWAIALHLCVFDRVPAREAFAASRAKMTGFRGALFRRLLVWAVIRFVLASAVLGVVGLILADVPAHFVSNLRMFFVVIGLLVGLWLLVNSALNAVANGALSDILNEEFDRALAARPARLELAHSTGLSTVIALPVAMGIAAVAVLFFGGTSLNQISGPDRVEVIGHRGAAASRPENTMAAVVKAVEDGADWVEIDVQETADGEVIVVHDSDFMKSAGEPLKVWDATMEDIARIDIGSWFDPAYADERAPRLEEVLQAVKDRSKLLIELKYYGHDVDLENRVIALVEAAGMADQIATMSLKYPAVQKMRALRPDWRTGVLAATSIGNLAGLEGDFLAVSSANLSPRLLRRADAASKDVYVWTVNDAATMSRMIALGADGLITDRPDLARQVIAEHQMLTTAERVLLRLGQVIGFTFDITPGPETPV